MSTGCEECKGPMRRQCRRDLYGPPPCDAPAWANEREEDVEDVEEGDDE